MDEYRARQLVKQRRTFRKVQKICDEKTLPYPPELIEWLTQIEKMRGLNVD